MRFDWRQVAKPPAHDEAEITVIGPGFGECIVVHSGDGQWLIVDSCREPDTKSPVALHYLNALGVDPVHAVRWVVATHWHADHVGGLGEVFAACRSAQFFCAAALGEKEFIHYLTRTGRVTKPDNAKDFRQVFDELVTRRGTPFWTLGGRVLFTRPPTRVQPEFRIEALSPSDKEYSLFLDRIASDVRAKGVPYRAVVASDPNHLAIVLSLRWGNDALLLGADLLREATSDRGWLAAVSQGQTLRAPPADLVKIPHHGSAGAHSDEMWTNLLARKPESVLTPYSRGKKDGRPPKRSDLERISSLSRQTILTAPTESGRARKKNSAIALALSQRHIVTRRLKARIGIARFRRNIGSRNWNVELFGQAKRV